MSPKCCREAVKMRAKERSLDAMSGKAPGEPDHDGGNREAEKAVGRIFYQDFCCRQKNVSLFLFYSTSENLAQLPTPFVPGHSFLYLIS